MNMIIDTHTHLYDLPDIPTVLSGCATSGVSDIVVLGVDLESNRKHLELRGSARDARHTGGQVSGDKCLECPRIHLALGLHPGNITSPQDTEDCLLFMREHVQWSVAIGEMGLDYHYKWVQGDEEKKREQKDVYARQLALAKEFHLPAVIHSRGACRDALDMALGVGVRAANFHWYTGPLDVLKDILDAGFFVSVSPALEYSPQARAVAEYVPLDRILVETDTPVRGWRPWDVRRTLGLLSAQRGVPEGDLLAQVNANAKVFFNL